MRTVCHTARVTTTFDPTTRNGHPSLLTQTVQAARPATVRAGGRIRRGVAAAARKLGPVSGSIGGLAAFTTAGFLWAVIPGCIVLGVSLVLLEWRVRG